MTKKIKKISLRAYAKSLGINDKSIRNAIAKKQIKKGVVYRTGIRMGIEVAIPEIIQSIADKEYGFRHQNGKIKPGQRSYKIENAVPGTKGKISADFEGCGLA